MNTIKHFALLPLLTLALNSCREEEVPVFSSDRGVNFILYDAQNDEYTDNYEELKYEHNYFEDYAEGGYNLPDASASVGIQLEGTFSNEPITVKIKAEAVDGYDMPDIEFPTETVIPAGEYRANFNVLCKKPQTYDKVYKTVLTFDYDASGLTAGTKERQQFEITVSDAAIWEDMYVANETEWNNAYSHIFGDYAPVKCRAIFVGCGSSEYSGAAMYGSRYCTDYSGVKNYFNRTKQGYTSNSFAVSPYYSNQIYYIYYGLLQYQSLNGTDLPEADGTPVTYKFLE